MDYKKYILIFLICFCVGMTIWFCVGLYMGVTYDFVGAGVGFGVGYTGAEMVKDYFKKRKNEKTNQS